MKILLISTAIFPVPPEERYGGVESLVYDYCLELSHLGHEVTLAAPYGSKPPKGVELFETVDLSVMRDFGPAEERAFYQYAPRLKEFNVIHDFSHSKQAALRDPSLPTINVCWFDPEWFTTVNNGAVYPMPSCNVVALSQYQAVKYQMVYKRNALIQSTNCRNPEKYCMSTQKGDRFLFIGKMTWHKGAQQAINFCQKLGVGLDLAGGSGVGEPHFYRDRIIRQCDDKQFVWHGEVSEPVKIGLLQHAKALLYPCQFPEAHNLVVIEALMCGTPIITFNRGAMSEVVADCLGTICKDDEEFMKAMRFEAPLDYENGAMKAHEHYSSRKVVPKYVQLYEYASKGVKWQ